MCYILVVGGNRILPSQLHVCVSVVGECVSVCGGGWGSVIKEVAGLGFNSSLI